MFRAYGTSGQAQWTPQAAGNYVVQVRARSVGSILDYEHSVSTPTLNVSTSTALTVTSFATATPFPAPTGTPITWTARATGGSAGPQEYQFWRLSGQTWTKVQPWGPSSTFTWTPTWADAGQYSLQVWVRNAGSTAAYDAWRSTATPFQIQRASLQLTTTTQFPSYTTSLPIVWTAHVPDSSVTFQYQFWVYSAQTDRWTLGRDYGSQGTFAWTPAAAGQYRIQAWARQTGSTAPYEVYLGTNLLQVDDSVITATPSGGLHTTSQTVALQEPSGATIRYTTDNTTPTTSSPIYSGPIAIDATATLRAKVFQGASIGSYELIEAYVIDPTPPAIRPTFTPERNPAGWNHSPVVVSFTCTDDDSGVATCPAPVSFSTPGAGQTVNVTSSDIAGNVATLVVTVNIDTGAPTVSITTPSVWSTTSTSVVVTATISDDLSGATAACNGIPAQAWSGGVVCFVPVSKGLNEIIVQAMDAAGNVASASAHITRTGAASALTISPAKYALVASETARPLAVDDYGQPAAVTWSTSDPSVATIDGEGVVTALAPGQATITASAAALSAQATVTVLPGITPPVGTEIWAIGSSQLYRPAFVVGPTDDSTIFVWVENYAGSPTVIKGFNSAGQQTRQAVAPLGPGDQLTEVMGDGHGGVVFAGQSAIVYASTSSDHESWRYTPPAYFTTRSTIALAPDGTLFALEDYQSPSNAPPLPYDSVQQTYVIALDSQSGSVKFRVPLPQSQRRVIDHCSSDGNFNGLETYVGGAIAIDANGRANVQVVQQNRTTTVGDCSSVETTTDGGTVLVYQVSTSGVVVPIVAHDYTGLTNVWLLPMDQLLPDDQGGVLATWVCNGANRSKLVGSSASSEFAPAFLPEVAGSNRTAYGVRMVDYKTFAMDMSSGAIVPLGSGSAIASLIDGSVYTVSFGGSDATITTSTGSTVATGLPPVVPRLSLGDSLIDLRRASAAAVFTGRSIALNIFGGAPVRDAIRQRIPVYPTVDDAIMAAFKVFLPRTKAANREFGGSICPTRDGYAPASDIKWGLFELPNGFQWIDLHPGGDECDQRFGTTQAFFRTHRFVPGDEAAVPTGYVGAAAYFDLGSDLGLADVAPAWPFYLGTRNSQTWPLRQNPPASETHILKYQGPQSKLNIVEWDDVQKRWVMFPGAPW